MTTKIILFTGLLILALAERLWLDLGPNVELIMVTSVLASMYLGKKWGAGLAVLALAVSDMVIGNTMIMVFTWSAFTVIGMGGYLVKKWQGSKRVMAAGGYGLISAWWFYFYTNFGVWLITPMYQKNLKGLVECYMMGLPFLRIHLVTSVILVSGGVLVIELVRLLVRNRKLVYQSIKEL